MTCPHGIIIGGFWSVACSLETGQTKIEWKRYEGGKGISTCKRPGQSSYSYLPEVFSIVRTYR